jgi:hypothetical protein
MRVSTSITPIMGDPLVEEMSVGESVIGAEGRNGGSSK